MGHDLAIEALKKELEVMDAKKKRLASEVATLRSSCKEVEDLKAKVESLDKCLAGSKAAEQLALERAEKAVDAAVHFHKVTEAETESDSALATLVELLSKHLEDAKAIGLSAAKMYTSVLADFGAITPPFPSNVSAYGVFGWLKSNFSKLPYFVTKVGDFAAVCSATNLSKTLAKSGCNHIEGLWKKEFESPAELGEASRNVTKAVKNFISSFWFKFGRDDARLLAGARRAAVHPSFIYGLFWLLVTRFLSLDPLVLYLLLLCCVQDLQKAEAHRAVVEAQSSKFSKAAGKQASAASDVKEPGEEASALKAPEV